MFGWRCGVVLFSIFGLSALRSAAAEDLAGVFSQRAFAQLGLAPLGSALAASVASAYPVASASSSVVYEYSADLDTPERQIGVAGPLFGERAETIARGQMNVGVTYSYLHFATINGDDLSSLPSRKSIRGRVLFVRVPGGVVLRNGRFTTFLPVQVAADIDVTAHQLATSITYGVTSRLDVNLTVPLLHTSLDLAARGRAPDPRFAGFALPQGQRLSLEPSASADATGVGDILVRAKYLLHENEPVDVAVLLALALPSGDEGDFQGAGTTRLQPMLVLSRVFSGRFEPFLDLGVDCNADDVNRSVVRWAAGASAELTGGLTGLVTFLGRNELGAQAASTRPPFFFQIERNDVYDASLGVRWRFAERGIVSANVIVPLNRDGLRADAVPTLNVEYAF